MTRSRERRFTGALHLFALTSLALAQPLFDLLGRNAEFFVASRSGPFEILVLVALLAVGAPAALVLVETVAGLLSVDVRRRVHLAIIGVLIALIALPVFGRLWTVSGTRVLITSAVVGFTGAIFYWRFRQVRQFVSLLSIAIVVVPANFLLNSSARHILFPSRTAAAEAVGVRAETPIVLLIFDELPLASLLDETLHIDAERYPNFARLATSSTWYRNATSVADGTTNAVPAILTGRYPTKGLLPTSSDHPNNLFALLAGSYEMASREPITQLCPKNLCDEALRHESRGLRTFLPDTAVVLAHALLPPDIATATLPPIDQSWAGFVHRHDPSSPDPGESATADRRGDYAGGFTSARNALYVLHFLLPHVPWIFLPSGDQYDLRSPIPGLGLGERWSDDVTAVRQAYQRHLLQLGFTDRVLGRILDQLETAHVYDDSLLIVVADHGCTFGEGLARRILTENTWSDVLRVPLFIKFPGQRKGVMTDMPVQTIDLLPTIAEVLGISLPFGVDGQSIVPDRGVRPRKRMAFDHLFSVVTVPSDLTGLGPTVARKTALFGAGQDTRKLFAFGSASNLVGQRVDQMTVRSFDALEGYLTDPNRFSSVQPDSGFVPALISGRVSGAALAARFTTVAVAVNGVVRAVVPLTRSGQDASFQAVVPSASFRAGRNDVDLLAVAHAPDGRVAKVHLAHGDYRLSSAEGEDVLELPLGRSVAVRPGRVRGFVEESSRTNLYGYLSVQGWLVDPAHVGPPEVVAFADGRLVGTAFPTIDRHDVVKNLKDDRALRSGFTMRILFSDVAAAKGIRVFGVSAGGQASELGYDPTFSYRTPTLVYTLDGAPGRERLKASVGAPVSVRAGAVAGWVDAWSRTSDGNIVLSGWAADRESAGSTAVLVFADGRLVASARPTLDRPDVARYFKDRHLLRSGYVVRVSQTDMGEAQRLRVFGLADRGVASELSYSEGFGRLR